MEIAIISGEPSGDALGAELVCELKRQRPDCTFWGLGSGAMRSQGVRLLADSASWGAIGVIEALTKVPVILTRIAPMIKRELAARRPDLLVLVDFGAFNVPLGRFARSLKLKTFYFVPPGSWRRIGRGAETLVEACDAVATPFAWSAEYLSSAGLPTIWCGHPVLDRCRPSLTRAAFCEQFGLRPGAPIIALLPGSRTAEASALMPVLVDAASEITAKESDAQFVVAVAPSISREMMVSLLGRHPDLGSRFNGLWRRASDAIGQTLLRPVDRTVPVPAAALPDGSSAPFPPEPDRKRASVRREAPPAFVLVSGMAIDVMAHANVVIACSGTATLEAAVLGVPTVIVYKGSQLQYIEYKLRGIQRKVPFIGIPNILAEHQIMPELLQNDATPSAVAAAALELMNDVGSRAVAKGEMEKIKALLGSHGAAARAAEFALSIMKS
ncbi:MAG: hypothetical protein KGJ62_14640 [Armatimonadetes bacterium]|nr:hypothetical protein [Armatimonadota bacterium]MDE2207738.1 hypothetical protein [Armatimonadota bacterium]